MGILLSGRGSNMAALVRACREDDFPAQVVLVLSNEPDAPGLAKAHDLGLEVAVMDHRGQVRQVFEQKIDRALRAADVDVVCLAGFMRILSPWFVARWPILNIHPSLLPKHKGLNPQQQALDEGVDESGCTVHLVTTTVDEGPILIQQRVCVLPTDTADTLAQRILALEHQCYPQALRLWCEQQPNANAHEYADARKEDPP